jgi:hypothetical protein
MSDEIAVAGQKVVELLGDCATAPDDLEIAKAADDALRYLECLLADTDPAGEQSGVGHGTVS